jgi:hypothetical protein
MLANSSDNAANEVEALKRTAASDDWRWSARLLMLGLNFIPALHAVATIFLLVVPYMASPGRIGFALIWFYLVPALVARLVLTVSNIPEGRIPVSTKSFLAWWTLFQLQVIYCRLPVLEEILRLIPGLYSQWLKLWGSHIGRFTYWAPGTLITDRSFLSIGDDVVFGAGVRLNAHVLAKGDNGKMELLLARVAIGNGAIIGGYSLLTAGTEISAGEVTRAFLVSPPFSVWKDGKRLRRQQPSDLD